MNMARQLLRSLVLLGALLGVFALHGLSDLSPEPPAEVPAASVATVLPLDPHGVMERLEQVAMGAPDTLAVDPVNHKHALPCLTFAAGSFLLLLAVGLFLRRVRFAEAPRLATVTLAPPRRRVASEAPDLTRLCILRT
ncbi:hypothetical protein ACWCOV_38050 [Kribbella sp. NPDC002412]